LFGGRVVAGWLANPVSAKQIAKWTQVYANVAKRPSTAGADIVARATRTLAASLLGTVPAASEQKH